MENYLEDCDNIFQFAYSKESIKWFFQCPDYFPELFISVRLSSSKKLVATIFGLPCDIKVHDTITKQVEINFLCILKKLRSKRLAPVLIKEITRRAYLRNIYSATYTASLELPNVLSTVKYYHRFINVQKLYDINFISKHNNIQTLEKICFIDKPTLKLRLINESDIDTCLIKLNNKLKNYKLAHIFDKKTFKHYFMSRDNVVYTYVVENNNEITDMISFFVVDNRVLNNKNYTNYKTGYLFYYFNESSNLTDLVNSCLYYAKYKNVDVFNTLNIFDTSSILKDCKFVNGDGSLNYYLFNYKCNQLQNNEIGIPVF